jgi:RNA polymerase sigma-70 factor, ECF subfamily
METLSMSSSNRPHDSDPLAPHRGRLLGLSYRMLGSRSDAEDVLQDAYLRFAGARDVQNREAFLVTVVTRLCLDRLKSAKAQREVYVGPWLPEPIFDAEGLSADAATELADDLSFALLLTLDRLSPLERAAFLLHDVFGQSFDEVAQAIDRDPAACRQLAARARDHVRAERPRFPVDKAHGLEIAAAFFAASRHGEMARLSAMLAKDVAVYSDGGGKRPAGIRPIRGISDVMRMHTRLAWFYARGQSELVGYGFVNGLPGFVTREADGMLQTTALLIEEGQVRAVYVMRNPDKLGHLAAVH